MHKYTNKYFIILFPPRISKKKIVWLGLESFWLLTRNMLLQMQQFTNAYTLARIIN